jgi:hypothetical protein
MDLNEDDNDLLMLLSQLLKQKSVPTVAPTPSPAPTEDEKPAAEPEVQKKKRCQTCKKKLGLIAFPCKCGGEYCAVHRSNADHNCTYDYQADAKKALSTMLVKVEAKKVEVL